MLMYMRVCGRAVVVRSLFSVRPSQKNELFNVGLVEERHSRRGLRKLNGTLLYYYSYSSEASSLLQQKAAVVLRRVLRLL